MTDKRPYDGRWQRLRLAKLAQSPLCELQHPGCWIAATQVDHIRPISQGGVVLDWDNIQSVCRHCHDLKTGQTDRGKSRVRIKGADPQTGLPLDEGHWWHAQKISQD